MKSRTAIWAFSGLFFAAIVMAVLGLTSASATDRKAQKNRFNILSKQAISTKTTLPKTALDKKNNKHQTLRVFWPIWNGKS